MDFGNLIAKYEKDIPVNILYAVIDEAIITEKVGSIVAAILTEAKKTEKPANG